jgi:RNA ligase (TIGR02306 family)
MEEQKNKRKLVSIRTIDSVLEIEGADLIETAKIGAWNCVIKKNEFKADDLGVYFEIDAFLPMKDSRFEFLNKDEIEFENEMGVRVRTRKFKGKIAQGLVLPLSLFPEIKNPQIGDDVTELLGIKKWEPEIPVQLQGLIVGLFPSFIRKTDQERAQNLVDEVKENQGNIFEATIKIDGSSMTVYKYNDRNGVCSRNLELKEADNNTYWVVTRKAKILETLELLNKNYAIQGELMGEGIQDNREQIKGHEFFVFDIFDIENRKYLNPKERLEFIDLLRKNNCNIKHVPFFNPNSPFIKLNGSVDELLELAIGPSMNNEITREGIVWKREDGEFSFKTISNEYLLEVEKKIEKANKKSRNNK